jgi:hypothetical protein
MKFITGQVEKVRQDVSIQGYKDDSPYRNNPFNTIYGTPEGTSITMEGVSTPLVGIDEFGNTQEMFPGQEYQYPGSRVIETPMAKYGGLLNKTIKCSNCGWSWKAADGGNDVSTCHKCGNDNIIMQSGGEADFNKVKEWYNNYIDSPLYKRNLENSGYIDVDKVIDQRKSNIGKTEYVYDENRLGTYYQPNTNTVHHAPKKDSEIWSKEYESVLPQDTVLAHEFGHSVLDNSKTFFGRQTPGYNKYDYEQLQSRNKDRKISRGPNENYADQKALQYEASKLGIYKPGFEEFTKDHLDKLPVDIKDRALQNYSEEDLIWLMNNIAQNDNDVNNNLSLAQTGGEQMFNVSLNEPMMIPSQGSYPLSYKDRGDRDTDGTLFASAKKVSRVDENGKPLSTPQIRENQLVWNMQKLAYSPQQQSFNIWKNNAQNSAQGFYNTREYSKYLSKINSGPDVGLDGLCDPNFSSTKCGTSKQHAKQDKKEWSKKQFGGDLFHAQNNNNTNDMLAVAKRGGTWFGNADEMSVSNKYQNAGTVKKTINFPKFNINDYKKKPVDYTQKEMPQRVVSESTGVAQGLKSKLEKDVKYTLNEIKKGNNIVKKRGNYVVTANNQVLIPVNRKGQQEEYVPYKTLTPEQFTQDEINKIATYKEALDKEDLAFLKRPLIYLESPEKILGDIGIPGMETSEDDRLYFAQRDNHPDNANMSLGAKLQDSFSYGLRKTPGAAFNLALAMLGNPEAGALRVTGEAMNPLPTPLPGRGIKIKPGEETARFFKKVDNIDDTSDLVKEKINPFQYTNEENIIDKVQRDVQSNYQDEYLKRFPDVPVTEKYENLIKNKELNEINKNRATDLAENWVYENPTQRVENQKVMEQLNPLFDRQKQEAQGIYNMSRRSRLDHINNKIKIIQGDKQLIQDNIDAGATKFLENLQNKAKNEPNYINELLEQRRQTEEAISKYGDEFFGDVNNPNFKNLTEEEINAMHLDIKAKRDAVANEIQAVRDQVVPAKLNPAFEKKIQDLHGYAGQDVPASVADKFPVEKGMRERNRVVYPRAFPETVADLNPYELERLLETQKTALGVNQGSYGNTYSFGENPYSWEDITGVYDITHEKVPFKLSDPSTWLGKKTTPVISNTPSEIIKTVKLRDENPERLFGTISHELGHDFQKFGDWGELLAKYDDRFKYATNHGKNELSKVFQKYMVEPTPGNKSASWNSAATELHSDLVAERFKIMNNLDPDPKKAVEMFRANEDKFNEQIIESGALDGFFKPDTPVNVKKKLINLLPAAVPVGLTVGVMNQNDSQPLSTQKQGGQLRHYDIGGTTVAEQYTQLTGKPWSTAKAQGLTDGSARQNLALIERLKQQIQPVETPAVIEVANSSDKNAHTREMAQRVVQLAEERIKNNNYIDVPDDIKKVAFERGEGAYGCIGGVCTIYKEAGVMNNVDWSNTHFAEKAKDYGFTANKGWGLKGIQNLEPGDMLMTNQRKNEQGNYYPSHSQIYLGKTKSGQLRFFDNFWKTERTYFEDEIKGRLDPARKKTEVSATIYKVNPYDDSNPMGLTPEELQKYNDKKEFIEKESKSKQSYVWSVSEKAKNYNDTTKRVIDSFIEYANDNDKINDLVKKTGKSKEEIHDSLLNVFGELGAENNWTTSKGKGVGSRFENIAESVITAFGGGKKLSVGPGQIKYQFIPKDLKEKFDIQSPNDLYDLEKVLPLMTALDLRDKQVLEKWGENNVLSQKLFGWTRPEIVQPDGTVTGGFKADQLYTETDNSKLNSGVGRYSPYLRNQYSSIASGTTWENGDDWLPFNEGTLPNFTEGRFTKSGEDEMRVKYERDPGSYPYKVEQNWRDNLNRTMYTTQPSGSPEELDEVVIESIRKKKSEMGGMLYANKDAGLPHKQSVTKYLSAQNNLLDFMKRIKVVGGPVPFDEYYRENIINPRNKS